MSEDDEIRSAGSPSADALAQARLAAIVESSHDAILAKDLRGIVTAWNPAAERLYGYRADEIVGRPVTTIIPPDHVGESERILEQVMAGRVVEAFDTERIHRDGTRIPVSVTVSPVRAPSGEIVGASTVARDIRDRLRAEAAREEAEARQAELQAELEQSRRLETVGALAGGIAHDFNNVLGVIVSLANLVAAELPEEATAQRDDVDEIARTAQRAGALTRQLLIFSRRDVASPEPVDLAALLRELEVMVRRAAGDAITVELVAPPGLPAVLVDPGQLEQVILNLAVNARDAMPRGGELRLVAELVEDPGALPSAVAGATSCVSLTVTDTGEGMPPDVAERAFEPFFTTKSAERGTGIGLATVHGIVTKAGGAITIDSEEGVGTSVVVHLPVTERAADGPGAQAAATTERGGETVVVVDDSEPMRRSVSRILERDGYRVAAAAGGAEALELVASLPDALLVVTDVSMPRMLGPELAQEVWCSRPEMRVLFMSGHGHSALDHLLPGDPRAAFLPKPFTAADLSRKVRELLDARVEAPLRTPEAPQASDRGRAGA